MALVPSKLGAEIDTWIAEVEKNQNDLYNIGFGWHLPGRILGEASKLFNDS